MEGDVNESAITASIWGDNSTNHLTSTTVPSSGNDFSTTLSIVIPTLFALVITLGLIGNVFVIIVVLVKTHMRSPTNLLLLSLAVADLSFLLICVPFTAYKYVNTRWIFGDIFCKIYNYMTFVCAWASVYTLVLLCIDRLFAVVLATKCPGVRTRKNVTIGVILVWLVTAVANIPSILAYGKYSYVFNNETLHTCGYLPTVTYERKYILQLIFFIFGFSLPVLVITILYGTLVIFIRMRKAPKGNNNRRLSKAKTRVTLTVVIVVSMFVVCWLPLQIIMLLDSFKLYRYTQNSVKVIIAANCLAYMNSCMNPILYTMTSSMFREAFKDLLCCKCKHGENNSKPLVGSKKAVPNGVEKKVDTEEEVIVDSRPLIEMRDG